MCQNTFIFLSFIYATSSTKEHSELATQLARSSVELLWHNFLGRKCSFSEHLLFVYSCKHCRFGLAHIVLLLLLCVLYAVVPTYEAQAMFS